MSRIQLLTEELFDEVLARAEQSPRRRTNHNFHPSLASNPHRFLNVMLRDTYVRPHRHLDPPKAESFLVLRGEIEVLLFDDEGAITERHLLSATDPALPRGIDLSPGLWHAAVVHSPHAIIFEVKPGPFDPATDKEFARWAPAEGTPEAATYLSQLREGGDSSPPTH